MYWLQADTVTTQIDMALQRTAKSHVQLQSKLLLKLSVKSPITTK